MAELREKFWENFPLEDLNPAEWEALCDGCGLCCLVKLEDEKTEQIYFTNLVCALYDVQKCLCSNYHNRHEKMPDCRSITLESLREITWLPPSCAYRLREQNKRLYPWHPLLTGNSDSVHEARVSVKDWTINEEHVEERDYEDYLVPDPFSTRKRKKII